MYFEITECTVQYRTGTHLLEAVVVRHEVSPGPVRPQLPRLRGERGAGLVGELGGDLQTRHQLQPPGQPRQQGVLLGTLMLNSILHLMIKLKFKFSFIHNKIKFSSRLYIKFKYM